MPELPEVETVRRGLLPHLVGQTITKVVVRDGRLRVPVDVARLTHGVTGQVVRDVERRSKYLIWRLGSDDVVLLNLGMTGRLRLVAPAAALLPHDHLLFLLSSGQELRFNDARRFGLVELVRAKNLAHHPRLVALGPEPFDARLTAEVLHGRARGKTKPVKNFLMDAHNIVGVGNIYANEALFLAAVRPTKPVRRIPLAVWVQILAAVRQTLSEAIEIGGTTLRDFLNVEGEQGYFALRLAAYGREKEPCRRCGAPIRRVVQAGRATFYCPRCQH